MTTYSLFLDQSSTPSATEVVGPANAVTEALATLQADVQDNADVAAASATLANHYANDATDTDVPGGAVGERGAAYRVLQAEAQVALAEGHADDAAASAASVNFEGLDTRYAFGRKVAFARVSVSYGMGDAISTDGYHFAKYAIQAKGGATFTQNSEGFWEIDARSTEFDTLAFGDGSEIDTTVTRYHDGLGVVRAWTDIDGSFASLIEREDGSIYIPNLVAPGYDGSDGDATDQDGLLTPTAYLLPLGDSLTAAGYSDLVSANLGLPLITPSSVSNDGTSGTAGGGIGSQTADQIAARFGALPLTCRVSGDTLSVGPNTLTSISVALLSRASDASGGIRTLRATMQTLAGAVITGTLRGALTGGGEITYSAQDYRYAFTPDDGQTLGAMPTTVWLRIDPEGRDKALLLLWIGRNNVGTVGWEAEVKTRIAACARQHKPASKRFVVIGVTNSTSEPSGSANHTAIVALNAELAALYPDNFLDIRPFYNAGEATDIPAAANTSDGVHYNSTGKAVIAAAVTGFIQGKGWA